VAFETNCRSVPVPFALLSKRVPMSLVPDARTRRAPSSFFRKHYCAVHPPQRPGAQHMQRRNSGLRLHGNTRSVCGEVASRSVSRQSEPSPTSGGREILSTPPPKRSGLRSPVLASEVRWRTSYGACCARAASGHAAAPPMSVMNARRFIRLPTSRVGWVSLASSCQPGTAVSFRPGRIPTEA
jgi:hypothetical protein